MGLNIRDIVTRKEITFSKLNRQIIAVDAFNALYQFISSIRQYDGTPLMDSKGRVTSHLSGLFNRNINLLLEGMRVVYVFDGEAPKLKGITREKRDAVKSQASAKYKEAKEEDNVEGMKKYSQQMAKLTSEMIKESKELLEAMGIAVIQAPGEGEAQASEIAKESAYGVASQDYDCLLYACPNLIQNLTLARKRKTITGYVEITPVLIELDKVLEELEINQEQLISLGILVGTDYNPKGIPGIGQKKALKIVQEHKTPEKIFEQYLDADFDWKEIFELFKKPKVNKDAEIKFPEVNENKIKEILTEHEFSEERIEKQLEKLRDVKKKKAQKTLF